MSKVPEMVGAADSVAAPFNVRLYKVAAVPEMVAPLPLTAIVPLPQVSVPPLFKVPPEIVRVPALEAPQDKVPLLVKEVVVSEPALKVRLCEPLIVTSAGAAATDVVQVTAVFMVTVLPAGGTVPPSHVPPELHSTAEALFDI